MPTGIAKPEHLTRIAMAMRYVEKKYEGILLKFLQDKREEEESKGRLAGFNSFLSRRDRSIHGGYGKLYPSGHGERKTRTGEKTLRFSADRYSHLLPDEAKEPKPETSEEDVKMHLKSVLYGNDIKTGGPINLAVRRALCDEGVPAGKLPKVEIVNSLVNCGEYDFSTNTIRLRDPLIMDLRKEYPSIKALPISELRKRIRFNIAYFSGTLIHEARHFEQFYKSDVYKKSKAANRMKLPRDYKKWFVETCAYDSSDGSTYRVLQECLEKKISHERDMLFGSLTLPKDLKPLTYSEWKKKHMDDYPDDYASVSGSFWFKKGKEIRKKYPDSIAEQMLEGRSLLLSKEYIRYRSDAAKDKTKWIEQKYRTAYNDYRFDVKKLSEFAFGELTDREKDDKRRGRRREIVTGSVKGEILFGSQLIGSERETFFQVPIEEDAFQTEFALCERYLKGPELLRFLRSRNEHPRYNYIVNKSNLPGLDV